jgi:hypothetical protein
MYHHRHPLYWVVGRMGGGEWEGGEGGGRKVDVVLVCNGSGTNSGIVGTSSNTC